MTEEAWRSEGGLYPMLQFLRERASQRKVLLFNCACCRRVWTFLSDGDQRAVVEFEMIADDPVVIAELEGRYQPPPPQYHTLHTDGGIAVYPAFDEPTAPQSGTKLRTMLAVHRGWSISGVAHAASTLAAGEPQVGRPLPRTAAERHEELARRILAEPLRAREATEQTRLLRDIFGNPFRPVTFAPEWRTFTAVALAQQMYESREFGAMPILADALQDAGCDSSDVLDHCRGAGPHVRGCWVVDMLLGKE